MKGKISKKVRAVVITAMIGIFAVAAVACGGGDLEGKWYEVTSPSENNYLNLEFMSDDTVSQGGVNGTYEETDEGVNVSFMGFTGTLIREEIEGCDVLHEERKGWYFTKSLDEAEKVKEALEE